MTGPDRSGPGESTALVRSYEVHVEGWLGAPLLAYLHWEHLNRPEQTSMRVRTTRAGLEQVLASCRDSGLTVEQVIRIDADFADDVPDH